MTLNPDVCSSPLQLWDRLSQITPATKIESLQLFFSNNASELTNFSFSTEIETPLDENWVTRVKAFARSQQNHLFKQLAPEASSEFADEFDTLALSVGRLRILEKIALIPEAKRSWGTLGTIIYETLANLTLGETSPLATKWLSQAARFGIPKAMWDLSHRYQEGLGIGKDKHLAAHWMINAADHGHEEAEKTLFDNPIHAKDFLKRGKDKLIVTGLTVLETYFCDRDHFPKDHRGILIDGPPGTGKTTVAQKIVSFFKIPESNICLIDASLLSASECLEKLRKINTQHEKHAIIIENCHLLPLSCSRIDTLLSSPNALLIAITTEKSQLKTTLLEKGRLATHLSLKMPGFCDREEIIKLHLKSPLGPDLTIRKLESLFKECSGADIKKLLTGVEGHPITLADIQQRILKIKSNRIFLRDYLASGKDKIVGLPKDLDQAFFPIAALKSQRLAKILEQRDLSPERGIFLYGPPGTGKSSIAQKIASFLDVPESRIEFKSAAEFLREAEKNIQTLFKQAAKDKKEADQEDRPPLLHVLILDDLTASQTQFNHLLTCLDRPLSLPNILVICITNHKELLDPPLLHTGKLRVHIHLDLPNQQQRKEILLHYLLPLKEEGLLAEDLQIDEIAHKMEGFSGADIKGLVAEINKKAVFQFFLDNKNQELNETFEKLEHQGTPLITTSDFLLAIAKQSSTPAFDGSSSLKSTPQENQVFLREYLTKGEDKIVGLSESLDETFLPIAAINNPRLKEVLKQRKLSPERGILLYGPPGTGKTSVARKIASFLNIPDLRIELTSASELLAKYVGESEKNIRNLFEKAREEKNKADKEGRSPLLHVVIVDEIESIARSRAQATHSYQISELNQLLTCLDGLHSLPNILVIGITNHREMLDPALLRTGRLGVHIHLGLPNEQQRKEILLHYLSPLKEAGLLAENFNTDEVVHKMEGFSGADIKGITEAMSRENLSKIFLDNKEEGLEKTLEKLERQETGLITTGDFISKLRNTTPLASSGSSSQKSNQRPLSAAEAIYLYRKRQSQNRSLSRLKTSARAENL